ncbi:MAG TPA: DUF4446 family protein [Candidatus Paceibacterota bacterium]|jgi:hypothetical protein|nr:DUF4446 family protein [Candidatus Paceibacterota bacterium]
MNISILFYALIGMIIILIIWIAIIEYRLKKFFVGTKAHNLERVLLEVGKNMAEIKNNQAKIDKHLSEVDNRLDKSIRRIETVRFNPFPDAGSNQSFAMAFLNDEGDGVIMSSLYARDRMSIFAKPIKKGKSEFELSAEEKEVLNKSK